MLDIGDEVPDFVLPLADREMSRKRVSLRELLARGPLVLSFYPLAFTGVCTSQVCEMRDAHAALASLDATVAGFSIDSVAANGAFARAHDLPYGIWSDANRDVVHRIWDTQTVLGVKDVAKRGWMVISADARVVAQWITDDADEWEGLAPIERALASLTTVSREG